MVIVQSYFFLNELHSILGTEFSGLGIDLEQYYSLYFTDDRQDVLTASNLFNQTFTQKASEMNEQEKQIKQLRDQMNNDLKNHDPAAYNQKVPQINAMIQKYNQLIREYNSLSRLLLGEEKPAENQ